MATFLRPSQLWAALLLGLIALSAWAQSAGSGAPSSGNNPSSSSATRKPMHYLGILRLNPAYHQPTAWTDKDNAAVGAHFQRLKQGVDAGQVVLAGRTQEALPVTMGLVIFTAADQAAAEQFMREDPAVVAGIMSFTVHPYALALIRP